MRTVAILGRPNVGKSTLFNRLVGRRQAIVDDTPGVTRDRLEGVCRLGPVDFRVIDTAGIAAGRDETLEGRLRAQAMQGLAEADVGLLVVDARAGVTPADEEIAEGLRRQDKPILLLANKCEGRLAGAQAAEAWALGLGEPLPVSAEHGDGIPDLLAALEPHLVPEATEPAPDPAAGGEEPDRPARPLRLAIVGRPNAGKSSLVNRLIDEERLLTGPEPGLTRDSVAVPLAWRGRAIELVDTAGLRRKARVAGRLEKMSTSATLQALKFAEVVVLVVDATSPLERQDLTIARLVAQEGGAIELVDTAGLRRKARVAGRLEKMSTSATLQALKFAEVVVLVVDATMPLERQDLTIARLVVQEGRALVLALNKWDLVEDPNATMAGIRDTLAVQLADVRGVPCVALSALTGRGVEKLLPAVVAAHGRWDRRVSTGALNRWLATMLERHPPPLAQGRRVKIRYMTQAPARPPTFVLFANKPAEALPESYLRYLAAGLRDAFDLAGVPIRFHVRQGENPYAPR